MTDFSPQEQMILDDIVTRRTTSFRRPPWMQSHRATAIKAEAERRIGALPDPPTGGVRPRDTAYYHADQRVRPRSQRGRSYKIHEAGADGRPVCTMHQEGDWNAEYLGAGPVTCGKCARTRNS